jgi:hypothetical protein
VNSCHHLQAFIGTSDPAGALHAHHTSIPAREFARNLAGAERAAQHWPVLISDRGEFTRALPRIVGCCRRRAARPRPPPAGRVGGCAGHQGHRRRGARADRQGQGAIDLAWVVILLDTHCIAELRPGKREPPAQWRAWVGQQPVDTLYCCVPTSEAWAALQPSTTCIVPPARTTDSQARWSIAAAPRR